MKKIFVDAHFFSKGLQGVTTHISCLYRALLERHNNLLVYFGVHDLENMDPYFLQHRAVKFVFYRHKSNALRLLLDTPSIIRKYGIQTAHFQYVMPPLKLCRYVATVHDVLPLDFPKDYSLLFRWKVKYLFLWTARNADVLFTVSEYSKQRLSHFANRELIHVTPNAVEVEAVNYPLAKRRNYILSVSRFEKRKRQYVILQAYLELQLWLQGVDLIFVGNGARNCREFYEAYQATPEEARSHIEILENVSRDALRRLYREANLFVYPSASEGFGIPPLEAGVEKCPVIIAENTAMSDFDFFDRRLREGTVAELCDAITHMRSHPPTEKELEGIRNSIQKKYSWERTSDIFYGEVYG